jgi:hypothetical protein
VVAKIANQYLAIVEIAREHLAIIYRQVASIFGAKIVLKSLSLLSDE